MIDCCRKSSGLRVNDWLKRFERLIGKCLND